MDIRKKLAIALRQSRAALHLSQEQMAERCGISARHYCDIENEMGNPRLLTLEKLVRGSGIRLDGLM